MSELQNPLFDEEKEFLERKKLEYERALRGDVEHIKERSLAVGKMAAVGAGLAGGIWLITKAFGGKKRKRDRNEEVDGENADSQNQDRPRDKTDADYYTAGNGKRYKSKKASHSAMDSAQVFMQETPEAPDRVAAAAPVAPAAGIEDDPFQDLPYDDSRRLPVSHAFDGDETPPPAGEAAPRRGNMLGNVLQAFLTSDTGKVVIAQAAAVTLALVTKKAGEFFPAAKNSDLAASPGPAPVASEASPVASPAPSVSSDASTHPPSV